MVAQADSGKAEKVTLEYHVNWEMNHRNMPDRVDEPSGR